MTLNLHVPKFYMPIHSCVYIPNQRKISIFEYFRYYIKCKLFKLNFLKYFAELQYKPHLEASSGGNNKPIY